MNTGEEIQVDANGDMEDFEGTVTVHIRVEQATSLVIAVLVLTFVDFVHLFATFFQCMATWR